MANYFKNVVKSIFGIAPNFTMGLSYATDKTFRWDISGYSAYNNKIFYTGANIIVRKMIEAPVTFNKQKAKKSMAKFYSKTISNPERNTIKEQSLDEIANHELDKMLTYPIREDFWHNYIHGSGFFFFETLNPELSRNTKPIAIHSLSSERVTIVTNNAKFDNIERYDYQCDNGQIIQIAKEYIMHLKHWNPNVNNGLKGYGLDLACAKDIALNNAGNEAEGAAFVNGGRGTLFSSKADVTSEGNIVAKMSAQQMSALKETMQRDMIGASNNRRMKYTNGEVVVTPYGDTLAEMEINASENSRWMNIFAIMGIPKELSPVNLTSSENSVQAGYKALVTNLVVSELRKFDEMFTKVANKWWPDLVIVSDLTEYSELSPDLKLMKDVYGTPSLSENERRKIFGYDEIEGDLGKAILVNSGMMQLSDIVNNEFDSTPNYDEL